MKTRGLYVLAIALCAILALQGFRYWRTADVDEDILRSEMGHYRSLSEVQRLILVDIYHKMEGHARYNSRPDVKQAYADGSHAMQAVRDVVFLVSQAYGAPGRVASDEYVGKACSKHDEVVGLLLKRTKSDNNFMPIYAAPLDKDFPWLDLCKRECDLLLNFNEAMGQYLNMCAGSWYLYWGGESFLGNLGVKYLSDTAEIFMPSVIRRGETKLIEITASKKCFDNMIDSLQRAGTIPADRRPFYKGVIKLSSDDLSVKPLSNERQVITEHDYTVWRYDILGKDPGKKRLNCEVGVIVLDSLENPEAFYIPLKLPALEVY